MKLVNFRRLKIGRRSRAREREVKLKSFINHQLTSIKDKIYLLEKTWPNRRYKNCSGWSRDDPDDREMILTDQGGAVVPDNVTVHKLRPETHD
jgi:hypothetical protein